MSEMGSCRDQRGTSALSLLCLRHPRPQLRFGASHSCQNRKIGPLTANRYATQILGTAILWKRWSEATALGG
jgi:hypothetical protein